MKFFVLQNNKALEWFLKNNIQVCLYYYYYYYGEGRETMFGSKLHFWNSVTWIKYKIIEARMLYLMEYTFKCRVVFVIIIIGKLRISK